MIEIAAVICVGLLVGALFVRGYTVKVMGQLRRKCGMLVHQERRLRQECEQAEILQESAEARYNQTRADVDKYRRELDELMAAIARIETELNKVRDDD